MNSERESLKFAKSRKLSGKLVNVKRLCPLRLHESFICHSR
jgi:hypothetical protein